MSYFPPSHAKLCKGSVLLLEVPLAPGFLQGVSIIRSCVPAPLSLPRAPLVRLLHLHRWVYNSYKDSTWCRLFHIMLAKSQPCTQINALRSLLLGQARNIGTHNTCLHIHARRVTALHTLLGPSKQQWIT